MKSIKIKDKYIYIPEYNALINKEIKKEVKKSPYIENVNVFDINLDKESILKEIEKIDQVILELTYDCNLRCKYCVYGGEYFYHREIKTGSLSYEMAVKSLNKIFEIIKNRNKKIFHVGFYGGEPLLEFETLNRIVTFSKKLFKGWDLKFNMTTNATLLNNEKIDYLIKERVSLQISLDGPKENHDNKRVFKSGKGSFLILKKNLERIKDLDPKYYKTYVSFGAVYSPDLSITKTYNFFKNNNLVNENSIMMSSVSNRDTNYFKKYPYDFKKLNISLNKIKDELIEDIKYKKKHNSVASKLTESLDKWEDFNNIRVFNTLFGSCNYNAKLFVDSKGSFHICERINNTMSIGDYENGFNFERMKEIQEDYIKARIKCNKCDIKFLCSRCIVTFCKDHKIEIEEEFCEKRKQEIYKRLNKKIDMEEQLELFKNKKKGLGKTKRFHQYIILEKGFKNTLIINFLNGDFYQVSNDLIDKFINGKYSEIKEFVKNMEEERLIISVDNNTWVPDFFIDHKQQNEDLKIILEIENGSDLDLIKKEFSGFNILNIFYYGDKIPSNMFLKNKTKLMENNVKLCREISSVEGDFSKISPNFYSNNKKNNPCWGRKLAVSKEGKVKPCFYSEKVLGDLNTDMIDSIIEKAKELWGITKDKVKKCKDCEYRYVCFDCREMAYRQNGDLYGANPNCKYDPYKGLWEN